ncbi:MFS transporter [Halorientalis sp.]|uniref:MFS transporter n=1 Tax=Halorientalis sp. TaxID=1931229 RepID=UPI00260E82DD|nr:MFS transporter [Halorientalis sp.]
MSIFRAAFGDDAAVLDESNFQLLLLATVFPILGTALVSPVLESLIAPLGASPTSIGLVISFATAPAIVVIPVSGVLADRYGRRPVLVVALLLFGAGGSAIALTTDFRAVLALRAIQGVGFAGIVPTITASIGDMFDGTTEVTGQGLRMLVNGVSGAVFPLLAGALVTVAWQYPFLLYAVAFPVALVVSLGFTEPTDDTAAEATTTAGAGYLRDLGTLVRYPRVAVLLLARTLPVVVWIGFLTFNSLVVTRVMGGSPVQAGLLVAVGNVVFGVTSSQLDRILSGFGGRFSTLMIANLSLAVGFIGFLFTPAVSLALPWIVLAGAGFGISLSLYRSYMTTLAPESLRGGLVSLGAAGARITATVTPVAMGSVIDAVTPLVGKTAALQTAGIAIAIIGGGGGGLCLLAAAAAGPPPDDRAELFHS